MATKPSTRLGCVTYIYLPVIPRNNTEKLPVRGSGGDLNQLINQYSFDQFEQRWVPKQLSTFKR